MQDQQWPIISRMDLPINKHQEGQGLSIDRGDDCVKERPFEEYHTHQSIQIAQQS